MPTKTAKDFMIDKDLTDALRERARTAGVNLTLGYTFQTAGRWAAVAWYNAEQAGPRDYTSHSVCLSVSPGRRGLRFYCGGYHEDHGAPFLADSFRGEWGPDSPPAEVADEMVRWWVDRLRTMAREVKLLEAAKLTRPELESLVVAAGRATVVSAGSNRVPVMPWSRVGRVDSTFRKLFPDGTAWSLVMAFGKVVLMNPREQQPDQMEAFYKLALAAVRDRA